MTTDKITYCWRILYSIQNSVIYFGDGSFRDHTEYFNQADLLRTMKHHGRGVNKSALRPLLEDLVTKKFLEKREGKEQDKSQSKGEFKITGDGRSWLQKYNEFKRPLDQK